MKRTKPFLVRLPGELLDSVRHWAGDESRSVNGQIVYLLRKAVEDHEGSAAPRQGTPRTTPGRHDGSTSEEDAGHFPRASGGMARED